MPVSKGDFTIGTIVSVVLVTMVGASALFVATEGPLGQSIAKGFTEVDENTDFTLNVKSRNSHSPDKVLSDGALYVYHRASNDGCKKGSETGESPTVPRQNNNNLKNPGKQNGNGLNTDGYPGLEGSFLTRYPECAGRQGTAAADAKNVGDYDTGNDMEGIFSRLNFRIQEKTVLHTSGTEQDTWLEHHLIGASKKSMEQKVRTKSECSSGFMQDLVCGSGQAVVTGGGAVVAGPWASTAAGIATSEVCRNTIKSQHLGTKNNYVMYFIPVPRDGQITNPIEKQVEGVAYCTFAIGFQDFQWSPDGTPIGGFNMDSTITLCEGAEGYIQYNKGKYPLYSGEAGEGAGGDAHNWYPHIVIEKLGNCS
jgi:hypothetical protein